ncbi:MAG: thioredoxin family protein [bacterium]
MKFKYTQLFIFIVFISFVYSCCDCKKKKDDKKQIVALVGKMSWTDWKQNTKWKDYDANNYKIDSEKIKQLKSVLKNKKIAFVVFSANWCPDSESEGPKFYKLIAELGFPIENITLYGVARNKKEPTGEAEKYKIEKVPSVIILNDGTEIGRIVEFPFISWEDDLLTILLE